MANQEPFPFLTNMAYTYFDGSSICGKCANERTWPSELHKRGKGLSPLPRIVGCEFCGRTGLRMATTALLRVAR